MIGIQSIINPKASVIGPKELLKLDPKAQDQVSGSPLEQSLTYNNMDANEESDIGVITEPDNQPNPAAESEPSEIKTGKDALLDEDSSSKVQTKLLTPSNGIYDEETDSESDMEDVFIKRSTGRAALLSDDDDDDDDDKVTPYKEVQESGKKEPDIDVKLKEHSEQLFKSDLFDADSESENEQEKRKKKQKRVRATIVSDDDEDDDNDEGDKKADDKRKKKSLLEEIGSDSERGSGSDGETSSKRLVPEKDDLSDQNQDADRPDASERAKSPHKHGSRTPKPRRLKKEAIQKIHSESQRLIRESALRLPYHKPKQLTVDDFFNKRPPSARPLKPLRGLSRTSTVEKKLEPMEKENDAADLPDPFSSETEKTIGLPDDLSTKNINICDSLGSQTVTMATEHIARTDSIKSSSVGEVGEAKGETGTIGSKTENESLIDESVSLVGQKSGDLSPEGETVQTEAKVANDPKVGDLDSIKNTEGLLETSPGDGDRCLVKGTPASSAKRQSTAMRLLQASLDKFKNITPKLSGESERVICLEEETPKTEIPAGVENLMERFARHSTKKSRGRKTQQEVQLSIVKKATNEDGKEDLKQEHISIILEPEEQEINPKLKVPGAKLLHLKETLQQRMKERRQQEREKRQMAYNIDNEEMGGGEGEEEEEEEEAELSDGDMSDEEYRMGAEVDSEEDDEDFNPDDEIVREKHMFADDEAEDDDDDEDSEGEVADDHVEKVESNSQKKTTPKPSDGNEDSCDEISPQSRKTKTNSKRRILLSDDEDDEDDDGDFQETSEIMSQIKIIQQAPKETVKIPDIHQETSTLSSSSSSKTSSVKKSDSSSVTHYFPDVGKTMDLFDSTSSLTDDLKNNDLTSEDKQTTFNLKEHLGRQDTSTLSSSSSSKTSSVKKSDSSSVTHYFPGVGKTLDLFDSTSSLTDDLKNNDLTSDDKQTTFNLKEHLGRQDSVTSKTSEADNNSVTSLDNSFEMFPATIPPYQPRRESLDDSDDLKSKENFTPFSKAKISLEHGSAKSTSKFPELSLPVEDSQDLFQMDTPSLMMPDSQRETETQNFRFSFDEDETQTQFLDGNGFLKLKSSAKRPGPRKIFQTENASDGNMDELLGLCSGQFNQDDARSGKVFHNENASQGNMDELLGLCSGRFSKQDDTDSPKVNKNANNTQGNMNELLGLCSGQFKEDREDKEGTPRVLQSQTSFRKGLFSQMKSQDNVSELIGLCSGNFSSQLEEDKIDKSMQKSKESSDKDSESSFSLVFDQETLKEELREDKQEEDGESSDDEPIILTRKKKPVTKQKEEEDGSLLAYDSNDELEVNRNAFKGKTYSKFAKKKFFEQEAELSGSDADSDEDYDAEEEPDELELDREVEEQFKDTEELREQVNEIHMKATDDEDARRLRLFKEMYLRDGDLHSEKSRVRRFRWKHLDEMEMDGGGGGGNGDSEDEGAEEDDLDTQWRLHRYQREQWLKEQDKETGQKEAPEEPPPVVEDEDSQFPLSMKIVSRNNSKGSLSSSGTASNEPPEPVEKVKEKKEFNSPKPLKMHKHGSFLKRKKQELEKLASVVKPLANITRPKNNRGFIFQSLSQTNMETEKLTQPSKVKRSISVQGTSGQHTEGPQSKKPKLERSVSQTSSGSIFNHF
ncbi:claspin-like isoform X2 [Apostichopus japonicus]|uniref:claspin-like isoform X2 n=1 Tax=Stichopus japonicus TaxID=307972 RepID=UPI003AB6362E